MQFIACESGERDHCWLYHLNRRTLVVLEFWNLRGYFCAGFFNYIGVVHVKHCHSYDKRHFNGLAPCCGRCRTLPVGQRRDTVTGYCRNYWRRYYWRGDEPRNRITEPFVVFTVREPVLMPSPGIRR